jgi:thiosulfate sulfurtransferase
VKRWIDAGEDFSFIDVRSPEEIRVARIEQAEPLDFDAPDRYMSLPHGRKIVFHCQSGERSLDVAAYFKGHGFERVYSVRGGFEAWTREVGSEKNGTREVGSERNGTREVGSRETR